MIRLLRIILVFLSLALLAGCADSASQQQAEKYPRKPADVGDRKLGPAMLFLEAAERDADPNNVTVIPPDPAHKENGQNDKP